MIRIILHAVARVAQLDTVVRQPAHFEMSHFEQVRKGGRPPRSISRFSVLVAAAGPTAAWRRRCAGTRGRASVFGPRRGRVRWWHETTGRSLAGLLPNL